MITSTGNARIRELVRLKKSAKERAERGVFLVEGPKMFREIPGQLCREVYVSESCLRSEEGAGLLSGCAAENGAVQASDISSQSGAGKSEGGGIRCGYEVVSDDVFACLSDTKTPQGILAVVKQLRYRMEDLMGNAPAPVPSAAARSSDAGRESRTESGAAPLIVVLENIQDPGNLGTILRSAEAAGATGILLSRGCADLYNPKVTRSTMGSIFRVPFVCTDDLQGAVLRLKEQGVRVLAAHLKGSADLYEESCAGPVAFLIGNESRGLSDETASLADRAVRIPMSGRVESLNAAVAASILLFEAKRQRLSAR